MPKSQEYAVGERIVCSRNGVGKLDIHMQKERRKKERERERERERKLTSNLHHTQKLTQMYEILKWKTWNHKTPKGNTGCKFLTIGLGDDILNLTPKPKPAKTKNKQLGMQHTKGICTAKETTEWKGNILRRIKFCKSFIW